MIDDVIQAERGEGLEVDLFRLLVVEDQESDIEAYKDSVDVYRDMNPNIDLRAHYARTTCEANELIHDRFFDAIIIDMKLDENDSNGGVGVLKEIKASYRMPIAIVSGTPRHDLEENAIPVYVKGEADFKDVFDKLMQLRRSPLFKVLGQEGDLDAHLREIFWERLCGNNELSCEAGEYAARRESLVLRQAVVHLQALTTQSGCTQECIDMYIQPFDSEISTGMLVRDAGSQVYRIVLSPPCDLAVRDNGTMNTKCILLCLVEPAKQYCINAFGEMKTKEIRGRIKKLLDNNLTLYQHWLAPAHDFEGGFIDFRDAVTCSPEEFEDRFESLGLVVQEGYMKNVLSRFGSYYNRQGQPDTDRNEVLDSLSKAVGEAKQQQ